MRNYKFKHYSYIIAQIGYSWSTTALIMTKNRVVICSVPVNDILKSKSWIKIKNKSK